MPKIQSVNSTQVAIGLEWASYADKKTALSAGPKGKHVRYAIKSNESETLIAFTDDPSVKASTQAGALLLSASQAGSGSALVYHDIGGDLVWVCACAQGLPVPGADLILPKDKAITAFQSLQHDLGQPVLYGDLPQCLDKFSAVIELLDKQESKSANFQRDSKAMIILISGLIALLLVAGGTFYFVQQHIAKKKAEEEMIALQIAEQLRLEQESKALQEYIFKQKLKFLQIPDPNNALSNWLNTYNALPITSHGWQPTELKCSLAECEATWLRMIGTYPSSYREITSSSNKANTLENNDLAKTYFDLTAPELIDTDLAHPAIVDYYNDLSLYQEPIIFSFSPPSPVFSGVPESNPNIDLQEAVGREGTFTLRSTALIPFYDALKNVLLTGTYLKSIHIASISPARDNVSFEANGAYKIEPGKVSSTID